MPEHNPGQMGGTMRLGKRKTVFKTENSVMRKCAFGVHVAFSKYKIAVSMWFEC